MKRHRHHSWPVEPVDGRIKRWRGKRGPDNRYSGLDNIEQDNFDEGRPRVAERDSHRDERSSAISR